MILTEIASVLIFPASATGEALRHMRTALNKLAELDSMTWQDGPVSPRKPGGENGRSGEPEVVKDVAFDVDARCCGPCLGCAFSRGCSSLCCCCCCCCFASSAALHCVQGTNPRLEYLPDGPVAGP